MRVLVLEDDLKLCRAYTRALERQGYAVDGVATLEATRQAVGDANYDCLVLDRLVPGGDAVDLVSDLAAEADRPAVLILTGLGGDDERVEGLAAGADDYVTKPVRLDELSLRVGKLCARGPSTIEVPIRLGAVTLDRARHQVTVEGRPIHLTPVQYAVFEYLAVNHPRSVSSEELIEHCWDCNTTYFDNPVHSQITRLRKIFAGALRIERVRENGYVLTEVEPAATQT